VEWWNSLHQTASLSKFEKPSMPPSMYMPILIMAVAFKVYFVLSLFQRVRAELLYRERNSRWVEELARS
jgi:heme exporter protein C